MKAHTRIATDTFRKSWSCQSLLVNKHKSASYELRKSIKRKYTKSQYFPVKEKHTKDKELRFLIKPESLFKLFWDICCISITIAQSFLIPYIITFAIGVSYEIMTYLEMSNILLIIDIPISLNTCFYKKGKLITERMLIMKHYLRNYFITDIWSIFPFQLLNINKEITYDLNITVLILLLKILRLYHMKSIFFSIEDYWSSPTSVLLTRIVQFSIIFSLLCHWLTCYMQYFFKVSLHETSVDWILYKQTEYERYIRQIYIIIFTMTSVGYESPRQIYIIIFTMTSVGYESPRRAVDHNLAGTIFAMCAESLIFAFTLGEIQSIVNKYTKHSNETKDLLSQIKRLLDKKKIPKNLRYRIIRYVNYMRDKERENVGKEIELLSSLSKPLKLEIFTFTRSSFLENHAIFQNYSPGFIKFIGFSMRIQFFSNSDLVLLEGEKGTSIFFIINGSVDIYNQATKTIYKTLSKSKSFGELGFFLGICRTASVRCDSFTELVSLDRETFTRLLSDHPSEQEITKEILKRAQKDLSIIGIKCYLCKRLTHIAKDCKDSLIKLEKERIIKKAVIKRNTLGWRRINLAYSIDKKFMRSLHESDVIRKYSIVNCKGNDYLKANSTKNPGLAIKAKGYVKRLNVLLPISGRKLRLIQDSDSDSEIRDLSSSILPKSQRYIENFIDSRRKSNTEIPKIVIQLV
ncbi:hypothetical protein SteCoe_23124 [Stentor coeruleus]|uniref:Cyclic nucleotide-binding domain-containing protein n=1 Tax=Stentor coeruleus TaxID=5963 RepID=A0A1R2BKL3_9CILI|nr:hypothetical protein SteCoe_23124 [Stentor coeruleus]